MRKEDISRIVDRICQSRNLSVEHFYDGTNSHAYTTRYMVWGYLHGLGVTTYELAAIFQRSRRNICYGLRTLRNLVKYQMGFREMYAATLRSLEDLEG